jgi:hypothetical protein
MYYHNPVYTYGQYGTPSVSYITVLETRDQFIRRYVLECRTLVESVDILIDQARQIWDESIKTETK